MERRHIARVLEYTKGNKTEAARLLKIGLTTLYRKIEEYKIKQLKATTTKTKYTIIFTLTKKDNKWALDKVSDEDLKKIHGLSE